MSKFDRVTVYDKTTGKYIGKGGAEDPRIQKLRREGHIVVDGSHNRLTKYEFATGSVVVDLDKQKERQQRQQQDEIAKDERRVARQWLRDNDITSANQLEALRHVQTILK